MNKLPVVSTLIAFVSIVILLKLGFWQLDRAEEKQEIASQLTLKQKKTYPNLLSALNEGQEHNYKSVLLSGLSDNGRVFYWDNRVVKGKVGYEILAVLFTDAGNVLVNYGWVEDKTFRQTLPVVTLPQNLVALKAVIYSPVKNILVTNTSESHEKWPKILPQPDFEWIESQLQLEVLPFLAFVEDSSSFGLQNNFKPLTMSPQKHIGYAVQWFSLSAACLLVYGFALRKKWKEEKNTK